MGTWGYGSFENDGALDWLEELEGDGIGAIREALAVGGGAIEADDAQFALAAADIVAAARGHGLDEDDLPEPVSAWLALHATSVSDADVALARTAVARVRAGSELAELWEEQGPDNDWTRSVAELAERLTRCER